MKPKSGDLIDFHSTSYSFVKSKLWDKYLLNLRMDVKERLRIFFATIKTFL